MFDGSSSSKPHACACACVAAVMIEVPMHEIIASKGSEGDALFIIHSGQVGIHDK